MTRYEVLMTLPSGRQQSLLQFQANFAQASCPIMVGWGDDANATPFQVADARHDDIEAAKILNRWLRGQGGEAWEAGSKGLTLRRWA